MLVNNLFLGHEVIRTPLAGAPATWNELITLPRERALLKVSELLGASQDSILYKSVRAAWDIGIVLPARKRDKRDLRLLTLAIMYAPMHAMLFSCPIDAFTYCDLPVSQEFKDVVSTLGAMKFDQYSGVLMWPSLLHSAASQIELARSHASSSGAFVPFYDHKTGDFDGWVGDDYNRSFTFCHETCDLNEYCVGGFSAWVEKRFEENYNSMS